MATSVASTASIVAIDGANIAAPLAIPPMVAARCIGNSTGCCVSLGTVSVVIIASAAASPPAASALSCAPSFGTPDSIGSMGIGMPMRPVWPTRTSPVSQPTACAVSSHMRNASARP